MMSERTLVLLLLLATCDVGQSQTRKTHRTIDPDLAYKNNCLRCHSSLPTYSPRMNKTIMLHMQQVALLPGNEAQAILRFLNDELAGPVTSPPQPTTPQSKP